MSIQKIIFLFYQHILQKYCA